MTPGERNTRIDHLGTELSDMGMIVRRVGRINDPLERLQALHNLGDAIADVRAAFADLKADAAAEAKGTWTHEQIAQALGVSKPYVQQMVYRGRR